MAATASNKFNLPRTTTYILFPLAFTGKDKQFRGLTNAYQFLLAEIYTMNEAVKGYAKLTYDHFVAKFGMSRETVGDGLRVLEERGIIEKLGLSRYKILIKFKKDYVIIDDYLHRKLWNVAGKEKRFARSRIKALAFLERSWLNPKTDGVFISSQARIGKAVNLPRTTAGDSLRELQAAGVLKVQQADVFHKDTYKRGLSSYKASEAFRAEFLAVKRCKPEPSSHDVQAIKALFNQNDKDRRGQDFLQRWQAGVQQQEAALEAEKKVERLQQRLLKDDTYRNLFERLQQQRDNFLTALRNNSDPLQEEAERKLEAIGAEIKDYLKARDVPPSAFPQGYFYIF